MIRRSYIIGMIDEMVENMDEIYEKVKSGEVELNFEIFDEVVNSVKNILGEIEYEVMGDEDEY